MSAATGQSHTHVNGDRPNATVDSVETEAPKEQEKLEMKEDEMQQPHELIVDRPPEASPVEISSGSTSGEAPAKPRRPRGFAAMDRKLVSEIARKGGKAAHSAGTAHEFTTEEARIAGRKGGRATHAKRRARIESEQGGSGGGGGTQ
jgi:hypothetical protein